MVPAYQRVAKSVPAPMVETLEKMARALEVLLSKLLCNGEALLRR
jgi:hypothetical protein